MINNAYSDNDSRSEYEEHYEKVIYHFQQGLPLTKRPFKGLAEELNLDEKVVIQIVKEMQEKGIIRRISAVPNHYALGYRFNLMTVWNVPDSEIENLGELAAGLDFVSHCYQRPRQLPDWPYNLFIMIHSKSEAESQTKLDYLKSLFSQDTREYCVLKSTKILKKTGLRLDKPTKN